MAGVLLAGAFTLPVFAQGGQHAQVFTAGQIQQQMDGLIGVAKAKGSSGATLGDYGSHALKLSERTASGGAEVHAHFDDVLIITGGAAMLITGGTVIDPKEKADGETAGKGIRDGMSRKIGKGDVVHIPAGTPHQLLIPAGTLFEALVIKVHE